MRKSLAIMAMSIIFVLASGDASASRREMDAIRRQEEKERDQELYEELNKLPEEEREARLM